MHVDLRAERSRCMELDSAEGALACVDRTTARRTATALDVLSLAWRAPAVESCSADESDLPGQAASVVDAVAGFDVDLRGEPMALLEGAAHPTDGLP